MKGRLAAMLGAMLLAFASCFFAPERPGGQGGGTDAAFDGPVMVDMGAGDDALMGSGECPSDEMDANPDPCGAWGVQDTAAGGAVARISSALDTKVIAFGDRAECVTPVNINFAHGVSIDLQQPMQGGSGDSTQFVVTFDKGGFVRFEIKVSSGLQIAATCSGPGGFSNAAGYGSQYRYLKFARVTAGSTTVGAFYSSDGQTWNTMGTCSLTGNNIDLAGVRFGSTAGSGSSASRAAVWDSFKTCTTK